MNPGGEYSDLIFVLLAAVKLKISKVKSFLNSGIGLFCRYIQWCLHFKTPFSQKNLVLIKLKVVLIWRDTYIGNIRMVSLSLIAGVKWRGLKLQGPVYYLHCRLQYHKGKIN